MHICTRARAHVHVHARTACMSAGGMEGRTPSTLHVEPLPDLVAPPHLSSCPCALPWSAPAEFKNQNEINHLPLELSADEVTLAAENGEGGRLGGASPTAMAPQPWACTVGGGVRAGRHAAVVTGLEREGQGGAQ